MELLEWNSDQDRWQNFSKDVKRGSTSTIWYGRSLRQVHVKRSNFFSYAHKQPLEGDVKKLLREKKIKPEDVPYMQRPGGMPDNSDLKKGLLKGIR